MRNFPLGASPILEPPLMNHVSNNPTGIKLGRAEGTKSTHIP